MPTQTRTALANLPIGVRTFRRQYAMSAPTARATNATMEELRKPGPPDARVRAKYASAAAKKRNADNTRASLLRDAASTSTTVTSPAENAKEARY